MCERALLQILDGCGFYFYHMGEQRLQLMRHVYLSHETSVANTLLKAVLAKLLPTLDSREKFRGGGRGEEGHYWGSRALCTEISCLRARQLV